MEMAPCTKQQIPGPNIEDNEQSVDFVPVHDLVLSQYFNSGPRLPLESDGIYVAHGLSSQLSGMGCLLGLASK